MAEQTPTTLTPEQVAQLQPDHRKALEERGVFRMADPADVPAAEQLDANDEALPELEADVLVLDFDELGRTISVEDAAKLERLAGIPFLDFHRHIRGVAAYIYWARRQTDPSYTYDDALKMPVGEVVKIVNTSALARLASMRDPKGAAANTSET